MKYNLAIFITLSIVCLSCCGNTKINDNQIQACKTDTVYVSVEDTSKICALKEQLNNAQDSLKFYRDSLSYANYSNARRIEKVKYYIKICEKRSANKKYFFGWIKRIMTE